MRNIIVIRNENNEILGKGFEDSWTYKGNDIIEIVNVNENNLPAWVTKRKDEIEWGTSTKKPKLRSASKITEIRNKKKKDELQNNAIDKQLRVDAGKKLNFDMSKEEAEIAILLDEINVL